MSRKQLAAWQLDEVQALGHVGTWEFHPPSERLVWSAETCRIMRLGRNGFDGQVETYLALVAPEDRDMVPAALRESRQQARPIEFEHRIVGLDGALRHVRVHGVPYRDESGKLMLVGTVHDFSESRQRFRQLVQGRLPCGPVNLCRSHDVRLRPATR